VPESVLLWPTVSVQPCVLSVYDFLRLAVTQDQIVMDVFGAQKKDSAFEQVDHFAITLK
jgi:hypothetical protein